MLEGQIKIVRERRTDDDMETKQMPMDDEKPRSLSLINAGSRRGKNTYSHSSRDGTLRMTAPPSCQHCPPTPSGVVEDNSARREGRQRNNGKKTE